MGNERKMSLERALTILARIHTRDDDLAGFVIVMDADLEPWVSRSQYIELWEVVRRYVHLQTEPAEPRRADASASSPD